MFDRSAHTYRKIILSIAVIGYEEEKIKQRGLGKDNLDFNCLFIMPKSEDGAYNSLTYNVLFLSLLYSSCFQTTITKWNLQNFSL